MGAIRLMGTLRPSRTIYTTYSLQTQLNLAKMKCMSNASGFNIIDYDRIVPYDRERKHVVVLPKAATCSVVSLNYDVPTQTEISKVLLDVATVVVIVRIAVVQRLSKVTKYRSWKSVVQLYIEKAMIDCRFFTMFAVGGTLLGSVLCFLEGTYLVVESYFQYFKSLSHHSDHGQVMQLLIEALDMFLVGTAMLVFGMGLHVMFVGSSHRSQLPTSNMFGINFYMKNVPSWAGVKSVTQAKSMIGYALMLLLQVGVLEKFKSVPLVTGLDLVCLAGAVFVSSAGLFILSKLNVAPEFDTYRIL